MNHHPTYQRTIGEHRRGAILPMVAVLLVALLIVIALTLNVSWLQLTKTQASSAADLASASALSFYAQNSASPQAVNDSQAIGSEILELNRVASQTVSNQESRLRFGYLRDDQIYNPEFVEDSSRISAVLVERDPNFRVPLFLGGFLGGGDDVNVSAEAISAYAPTEVILCLDASRSMHRRPDQARANGNQPPPLGSRWFILRNRSEEFLNAIQNLNKNIRVSLVTLGGGVAHPTVSPLDADRVRNEVSLMPVEDSQPLILDIMAQYSQHPLGVGTFIYDALETSTDILLAGTPNAEKMIVLLTDGRQWTGPFQTPLPEVAAARARDFGIVIHTVNFEDNLNPELTRVSTIAKGRHFDASNGAELGDAFRGLLSEFRVRLAR